MWIWLSIVLNLIPGFTLAAAVEPTDCASWIRISKDKKGIDQKVVVVAKHLKKVLDSGPPPKTQERQLLDDAELVNALITITVLEIDNFCADKRSSRTTLDTVFAHAVATREEKLEKLVQQHLQADPVYDPRYQGTTYPALGGPFLIDVDDSFFRKTGYYTGRQIMADGTFLFIRINIFNNSDHPLRIPGFTLEDSLGRTYVTASRARLFRNVIWEGESLNPGLSKDGYLVFDVPRLHGFELFPIRYKLLIANSRHSIDVNVYNVKEK